MSGAQSLPTMNDYAETYRSFQWNVPAQFNFAGDVVDAHADAEDGLALIEVDATGHERRFSYSDITRLSSRLADGLRRAGVQAGDRVIVMFPRQAHWPIAMVACLRLGAVAIPCIEMLTKKDVTYRVRNAGAKAVVTLDRNTAKFRAVADELTVKVAVGEAPPGWLDYDALTRDTAEYLAPASVDADDPAAIYYTSGSTGLPKGVTHASRALYAWRVSAAYWLDLTPADTIWCTADTGWSKAGTSILFGPWSQGACAFLYDGPFEPAERLRLLAEHRITVYCAAGTELLRVANEDFSAHDVSALRRIVSAGEAVNPVILERLQAATGCLVAEAYGQTETLMTVLNYPCQPVKPGSMGLASPGTAIEVLSETGEVSAPGEEGQLAVRVPNPQLLLEYWNDPERTAAAFVENAQGRWFLSGDLVHKDAEGYLYYSGRTDDVISSAGYRIGPFEVESALLEHDAVQECAVVASPDPKRGAVVKAFVVLKDPDAGDQVLIEALQAHVRDTTAPYKYPRKIEFVRELPKTLTGKIQRRALRDREYGIES